MNPHRALALDVRCCCCGAAGVPERRPPPEIRVRQFLAERDSRDNFLSVACCGATAMSQQDPFAALAIADTSVLAAGDRLVCPGCSRSCKNFCALCNRPLGHAPPVVVLPVALDMQCRYRHPGECHGKTTSTHAKLVATDQTEIFVENLAKGIEHTTMATRYPDPSRVLLLFPSSVGDCVAHSGGCASC
nr:DTW domain-containing protein 1 [Polyrhizophydium stewartii]